MDMKCPLSFRRSGLLQWQGSKQLTIDGGVGDNATLIWVFPKIGVKPPKWMVKIMENPIKMEDLGVLKTPPLFLVQHP